MVGVWWKCGSVVCGGHVGCGGWGLVLFGCSSLSCVLYTVCRIQRRKCNGKRPFFFVVVGVGRYSKEYSGMASRAKCTRDYYSDDLGSQFSSPSHGIVYFAFVCSLAAHHDRHYHPPPPPPAACRLHHQEECIRRSSRFFFVRCSSCAFSCGGLGFTVLPPCCCRVNQEEVNPKQEASLLLQQLLLLLLLAARGVHSFIRT